MIYFAVDERRSWGYEVHSSTTNNEIEGYDDDDDSWECENYGYIWDVKYGGSGPFPLQQPCNHVCE